MEDIHRTKERELARVLNAAEERLLVEFDEEGRIITAGDVEQAKQDKLRVFDYTIYPMSESAKDDVSAYFNAVTAFGEFYGDLLK